MIRRPPRSTLDRSSAASDVYKRQREDPVHVGIVRRIQLAQRVPGALEDRGGDVPLDITEELRVPAEPAHDEAREEDPEQQAPAPRVPALVVEPAPLRSRS